MGNTKELFQARGTDNLKRRFSALKAQGLQKSGQPQVVVTVQMREQYLADTGNTHGTHELTLGSLSAIHQNAISAPDDQQRAGTALDCGNRSCCPQKDDTKIQGYSGRSPVPSTICLLYTSPSPRDGLLSRMPSSA